MRGIFLFLRKHRKLIILTVMIVTAAASGAAGFIIAEGEPRIVEEKEQIPVAAGANDAERIAKGAKVLWHVDYKMCAHTITLETDADDNMIGLTFSEFSAEYPGLRIIKFTPSIIELKTSFNCYCPEHFILKKNGDTLAVLRTAPGTGKQYIYINTQICFDDIKEDERKPMEIGRVFGMFADLEEYIAKLTQ